MRLILAFIVSLALCTALFAQSQTGEFSTTFTDHNPDFDKKEILKRLGLKDPGNAYDLSSESFQVFVPSTQSAQPRGLIYWMNFKDTDKVPPDWKPLLEQLNLVFIVSKNSNQAEWVRATLALDAVHNAKKQFGVDEHRVFLFTLAPPENTIGQKMGLGFPDVFAGFVYIWNQRYFRPIPIPGQNGMTYATSFGRSPLPQFALAKARHHLILADPDESTATKLIYKAYLEDGFRSTSYLEVNRQDIHYPNLTSLWLEETIKLLDTPIAATSQPSVIATTAPSNEAQSQVSLARSYIASGRYDLARQKLNAVLSKNPDEQTRQEVIELLKTIETK